VRLVTLQAASPAGTGSASPHSTGCGEAGGTVAPALDIDLGSRTGFVRTAPAGHDAVSTFRRRSFG